MLRRHVVDLNSLLLGALSFGGWSFSRQGSQPLVLSAHDDADDQHYAVGYHLDGKYQFAARMTQRCRDIVQHPSLPLALFVARRPGTESYLISLSDDRLLQTLVSQKNRHFCGRGVFHRSGEWLYATENNTIDPGRDVLDVYRFGGERLQHSGGVSTHGFGPRQISQMLGDGTLVVTNDGICTEAESRVEMNLDAMESSLVLTHCDDNLLSKETLA